MPLFYAQRRFIIILNKTEKRITEIVKIRSVEDDILCLKDDTQIVMLQVEPINFKLKSLAEQNAILCAYESFLKICDFDFQIFVQTQKTDIDMHIKEIEKCVLYEEEISNMAKDYIKFIRGLLTSRRSMSRKFFVILKITENDLNNKISKIKGGLMTCGNLVRVCKKEEIDEVLKNCFKKIS